MSDPDSTLDNLDFPDLLAHFVDWAGRYLTWYNLNHSHLATERQTTPGSSAYGREGTRHHRRPRPGLANGRTHDDRQ